MRAGGPDERDRRRDATSPRPALSAIRRTAAAPAIAWTTPFSDTHCGRFAGVATLAGVQVTFYKLTERRVTTWEALRGRRTRVPGSTMALGRGGMPHDLMQLIVEATLGVQHGFWGCVAAGATFKSTGRKRNRPGRAVIAAHRVEFDRAEQIAGEHVRRWTSGHATPCRGVFEELDRRWRALEDGEGLTVTWPSLDTVGVANSSSTPSWI